MTGSVFTVLCKTTKLNCCLSVDVILVVSGCICCHKGWQQKFQTFTRSCLRRVFELLWPDITSNEEVRRRINQISVDLLQTGEQAVFPI